VMNTCAFSFRLQTLWSLIKLVALASPLVSWSNTHKSQFRIRDREGKRTGVFMVSS
jgi:hypothetical protein